MSSRFVVWLLACFVLCPAEDSSKLVRIDHYVRVRSAVPAMQGQTAQIYVREVTLAGPALRPPAGSGRVVLFVHGAGTPAEVAFDVPHADYSWMAYLAKAGYDVFSMDMTGYGRSTRPLPMNDPCNLSREQQLALSPACAEPSYGQNMTTIASDWNDIGAVVDYLRALRRVERVNLIGWSLGGPRAGGYTARNQDKVSKLILLSPAYNRNGRPEPPAEVPAKGAAMNTQSHADFLANWTRQIGCPDQYDQAASDSVWKAMLESDPVGATWGSGVRRAPLVTTWGWNSGVVSKVTTPTLLVAPAHDKQVVPQSVQNLHTDLGSPKKVLVDLACTSHNALWEKNHLLLFKASIEWLDKGTVEGKQEGTVRLGY